MTDNVRDHTLVLNKNWQPICITTAFSALISMCRERSHAMCPDTYQLHDIESWIGRSIERSKDVPVEHFVRTTRYGIEKPEVIIVKEYGGIPFKRVNLTKRNLFKRDNYTCQYCSGAFTPKNLTIDHVIPRSRGGQNSWTNCVTSCESCNGRKSNRTPQESGLRLLKEPRMPKWTPIAGMLPSVRPESWSKFLKM